MDTKHRGLKLNCNAEEYKQFKIYQHQADVKLKDLEELSTRREITKELKIKFDEHNTESYMADPTNLYAIKLYDRRVLVIGDLHAPFTLEGYLEHCIDMYTKWDCDTVVFIGDIVDHHYSSYHETDANALGGGDELQKAIEMLKPWHDAFPNAYVTIGNHDLIISRRATTSNIPRQWVRQYKDVLETPGWVFVESLEIDDVMYTHGSSTAKTVARNDLQSIVQGHLHSQAYIEYFVGTNRKIFAFQIGCGVDKDTYAMAYGKKFKKPIISCGVVIYSNPYLELMELK